MSEANAITGDELPTRWEIELEFVQSLANIQYLSYLAQNNYLNNPEFLNYLEYLNYWKSPGFAKHLVYPNCLHILTLLQNEEFRKNIVNPDFINTVMNDMVKRWRDSDVAEEKLEAPENSANGTENGAMEIDNVGTENDRTENGEALKNGS
ncbi:suppressor of hpr1 [Yamadazyma tenuis]|uniref:Mediator of RNA polymerase II transcription subunit 31 n=1 Tax=Candida tenuis (strain ATCC 10573 / BCRC 21748 / CBS 615 / JCM 9827 / NBRC 10315 / NRRL Y-1498 / VKM Y-70) TaxID=590646 RepID=G3BAY0_CANTC|nr:SOH1-domain-containing protein [Yamadazyma tenuis ATCC 10573]EGV61479.1 SOH1-domain-containing protein [Yamadazyma tenuis ATCC 10573]WEJ92692.1 suppressor of hpr1 [Yamadazyma tenuis]